MTRPSRTGGKTSEAKARNAGPAKGRKTTKTKRRIAPAATRVKRRSATGPSKDLKEAREQQAATAEILKVIASSPADVQPVFDAIVANADRLIGGLSTAVYRFVGGICHLEAFTPVNPAADEMMRARFPRPIAGMWRFERAHAGEIVEFADTETEAADLPLREIARARGFRSVLYSPLMSKGTAIGVIGVSRRNPGSFSAHHVELLRTFADQAVIAIENARLFNEAQEALERQTATADILKVIASSPDDVQPVFEAIAERSNRLVNGLSTAVYRLFDDTAHLMAFTPVSPEADAALQALFPAPVLQIGWGGAISKGETYFLVDAEVEFAARPSMLVLARLRGWRSLLAVPLMRERRPIGVITVTRIEPGRFDDHHVQLLKTFADQAVIAIENTRLFNETREALEHQTATAEVLGVISNSMADPKPVFEHIVDSIARLFKCKQIGIFVTPGDGLLHIAAARGENMESVFSVYPLPVEQTAAPFVLGARQQVYYEDCLNGTTVPPSLRRAAQVIGNFSVLLTPMLWEGRGVGMMTITREPNTVFSDKERGLLKTFADQTVIAIENARLFNEVQQRTDDLSESLQQQTATADVLKVISRSKFELQPVLDTLVKTAASLCETKFAFIMRRDGDLARLVAYHGASAELVQFIRDNPPALTRATVGARAMIDKKIVHVHDVLADPDYQAAGTQSRGGYRSVLGVPLLRGEEAIGAFSLAHTVVKPFTEKQIELVTTFADQAVIAIENVRLFNETQEALERQTATADILKVIASSPDNVQPVFEAIAERSNRLVGGRSAAVHGVIDDALHLMAFTRTTPEADAALRASFPQPLSNFSWGEKIRRGEIIHVPDAEVDWAEHPALLEIAQLRGYRSCLSVPLLRDGTTIGVITVTRTEPGTYPDHHVQLLQTFADQAVIAIGNVRLFEEVQAKTRDLTESLQQQTATADVLKIISRSSVDLATVLDTLVETVARLCRADQAYMLRRRDDEYHNVASRGLSQDAKEYFLANPSTHDRATTAGRVAMERRVIHIPDVLQDPEYTYREGQKLAGHRTMLGIPLMREETLVGIFVVTRTRVEPFTDKEIELATSFADQAVIAIENARLFEELRERQAELRVTFDNMGDGVVMFDVTARLTAWNRNFQEMLELPDVFLAERPSFAELFRYLADRGEYVSADLEAHLSRTIEDTRREMRFERTRPDGSVIEVRRNPVPGGGFVLIYADITERKLAEEAIRAARDAAETALRELQMAQASLVHAQKMAALGQLTAGIAHEIKNPLNFVNNFAGLSVELLDELREAAAQAIDTLDPAKRAEIVETIGMLTGNLEKIVEHGRRADGIVRSMLQHSRGSSSDWQATDLNALVEEALNLSYHGARAQDQNIRITLERDLDRELAPVDIVPQELLRVLLNLIGNGLYAANQRSREDDGGFRPALKVTTREFGESVEVRVRDNGIGIPPENREKLFQPFFTTKPTGEGTGLGLSISYEIVTQQHGGTMTVDSEVGDFTEFTVRLPRRSRAVTGNAG